MKFSSRKIAGFVLAAVLAASTFSMPVQAYEEDASTVFISYDTAVINEVNNYSHFYQTGQYYEGAWVVWKEDILLNGTPLSEYTEEEIEENGIGVAFRCADTDEPAIIDYDSPNTNYYGGPARVGNYYAVVTQTFGNDTRDISAPYPFTIEPLTLCKFTDMSKITSGGRMYLYSIAGEVDGQVYVMAMPEYEPSQKVEAIPVTPDENGTITIGSNRENIFMLKMDNHSYNDRNLYHLTTGTSLDIYFMGGSGNIARFKTTLYGDDGYYIDTDEEHDYRATIFEPYMGHSKFRLVKDTQGNIFFTRVAEEDTALGSVADYPVYLYWNQIPVEPVFNHTYEFTRSFDKEYDGEPVSVDPYKDVEIDSGKTSWGELEKSGQVRIVFREWQGKTIVDLDEAPTQVGMYQVVIQETEDQKVWNDAQTETFFITESTQIHEHDFGNAWQYDETKHWHQCECGEKSDEAEHVMTEWETLAGSIGVERRTCEVCGYYEDRNAVVSGWEQDETGLKYLNEDGSYVKGEWKKIDENWYHFDDNGYMQTGWYHEGSVYYFFKENGAMAMDEWVENDTYYLDAHGKWIRGKTHSDAEVTGSWKKDAMGWWYCEADGTCSKNKWKQISGKWYHFDDNGYMQTGWYQEGKNYYYLKENGVMASSEWVDGGKYYVDENGHWVMKMTQPENGTWKKDARGWWYQFEDGTYAKDQWKQIEGKWYHFGADGYMQTGWYHEGNVYYYFKSDGAMASDEWVDEGKYYVDEKGHWVKGAVKMTEQE